MVVVQAIGGPTEAVSNRAGIGSKEIMVTTTQQLVTCRLAQPHEGLVIRDLLRLNAGAAWDWLDWNGLSDNWLLAEVGGVPKGCIMLSRGIPVARVDMLSVDPSLPKRRRAVIARDLAYRAWALCAEAGASAILMMIEWSRDHEWMRVAQHRGAVPYAEGVFLVKPIKRGQHAHRLSR